jgi:uncharacterized protein (TIGR02217 family)
MQLLALDEVAGMTLPVFPALAGQSIDVRKKAVFSTIVANHVSGREVRDPLYANPIWQFEVAFEGLDGTQNGQYGALGASSLQALMGLFLQCQGQFGQFVFFDPTDYQVNNQTFGTGDGSTTTFQLTRSLGTFTEPIVIPVISATTLSFPGRSGVPAAAPIITVDGLQASASNYTISSPGGIVTFMTAPVPGAALSWAGCFGFLCRFNADDLECEQFMSNLWKAESVKFRSVRSQ